MKKHLMKNNKLISSLLIVSILLTGIPAFADESGDLVPTTVSDEAVSIWPEAPEIEAASAILIEEKTGVVLYEKNCHEKMFPASTTKLMTCLLAMETHSNDLDKLVSFSNEAVFSIPPDGSNMGIDPGEAMTLEECLYGIMVLSANEVSNAVAEFVSGTQDDFVKLMNKRAKELGCVDTHFNNAHGYTDPDHYTSAHDLAMIAREYFKNEYLSKISRTLYYHWYPTETQPDDIYLANHNYFVNESFYCEGFQGGKTGFTDESGNVLVTCAERNNMKLICVVMKESHPNQYRDTLSLFNYGFNNFALQNVSSKDNKFSMSTENFFKSDNDVFGNSSPIFDLDPNSMVVLPKTVDFASLDYSLSYNSSENALATVSYEYNGKYVGSASLITAKGTDVSFEFNEEAFSDSKDGISRVDAEKKEKKKKDKEEPTFIYVNNIVFWILLGLGIVLVIVLIRHLLSNIYFAKRRKRIIDSHRKESIKYNPRELSKRRKKW